MESLVFIGDLTSYQNEINGQRSRQYRRLLEQAERYHTVVIPAEHPKESTTYMGIAILNLALAYRLSGKEQYLMDAKRFIHGVLSYPKWGNAHLVNVDLSASWILFGLSLGYDWLKPYLTDDEVSRISAKIQHHAQIIYDYRQDTYGKGWSTNFYQNHNWINMTGLAAAGYVLGKELETARKYADIAKENFDRVFSLLADDGSNYEGVTYWRYGGMWLFVYAHLLKQQEGIDYFHSNSYLRNTFYYRLYQSCGDLKQQMNFGDCHDRYSGHTACVYYKTAAEYGDGYAQKLGNLVVDEFLMEEAVNSKVKPGILPEAVFEFLWYDPKVREREFSELPLVCYFDDLGLLSVRSSWERDAKVLTMKCSPPGGKKQWEKGWRIYHEEQIDLFSLSHHHPDNLSYMFAHGSNYLTCEDGYNRNLMPDNHNVLLVDGCFTDVTDVNDAYMASVRKRIQEEGSDFIPQKYAGIVTALKQNGDLVIYRADTSGIYPSSLKMKEASRLLLTDGLKFWIFVDVLRSDDPHIYEIISNTEPKAAGEDGVFVYPMSSGDIRYQVFSDKAVCFRKYDQQIISVMTTQEPDKVCKTAIQTLATGSAEKECTQVFFECFTFSDEKTAVHFDNGVLKVEHDGKAYELSVGPFDSQDGVTPVEILITGNTTANYQV